MRNTDYIHQLANYIKKNLTKGYTIEALKWALIDQGYSRSEVSRAIKIVNEELAKAAPKMVEKPKITFTREPITETEQAREKSERKSFFGKLKDWFS